MFKQQLKKTDSDHGTFRPLEVLEPRIMMSADPLGLPANELSQDPVKHLSDHPGIAPVNTLQGLLDISPDLSASASPAMITTQLPPPLDLDLLQAAEGGNAQGADVVKEIVFIDDRVDDYQLMLDDLMRDSERGEVEVFMLDGGLEGIGQITEVLKGRDDIDAIHVISHGSDQGLQIGGTWLTQDNLSDHSEAMQAWGESLSVDADLLIYGCNLAASADGVSLIDGLGNLTGADVAASDDLTGHTLLGGDWDLEHTRGPIETDLVFNTELQKAWTAVLAAPTVDLDTGTGGVDYAVTFTEGDGATTIVDATVDVADVDDTTLVNVTLDIGGVVDGAAEQLTVGDLSFALNAADFTNAAVDIGGNAYTVNWVNATGIATITLNSGEMTIAQSEAVLSATAYQHTDTENPNGGDRTIDVRVNDGDTDSAVATSTITVTPLNDAPTVDLDYDMGATAKDVTTVGQQVSTILAGITANDVDGDTLGIAVRTITALGTWQYSVDSTDGSDGTWDPFGGGINPNAVLLLDESTWVRYVPDGVNAETATFTFHAWDQTADTASGTGSPSYGDTVPHDDAGAYSQGTSNVTLVVSLSNPPTVDLDTGTGGVDYAFTFTEGDSATTIVDATVDVTDADDTTLVNVTLDTGGVIDGAAEELTIGDLTFALNAADFTNAAVSIGGSPYTVNWVNATGIATITLNSGEMTIAQSKDVLLATAYQHTDTGNPTGGDRTIDVRVNDGDADSVVATSTITVIPVNDPPVLTGDLTATVDEAGTYIIVAADLGYTDPDDVDAGVTFTTSAAVNGKIQVGGIDATTFTGTQLTAGQVTFVHDGSETTVASFDVNVEDGNEESSAPANSTFNFTVNPADDAININTTGNTVLFTEDAGATTALFTAGIDTIETGDTISQLVLTLANVEAGDTLSFGATNIDLNTNATTGPDGNGFSYTVSGAGASPVVTITHAGTDDASVNAMLNSLVFNNTVNNDPSTTARTVTLTSVTDSGSGTTLDGTIATVNVAPANDVPTLTSFAGVIDSVNEDTEVEITLAELKAQGDEADVDGTVDGFVIKALSSGTLKIGSTAGTAIAFVAGVTDTVDGTNNAYWTPSLNDTGAAINAFTAVALDNNGAESSIARQAQIDVVAVNDAPSGANNTVSLDEDSNYVFVAGDFGFSDPVEGDAFSGVVVTVAPTTGSLSLTGSGIVTNGQLIGIADINAGKLVFTPVAGASGAAYSSFSFQVVDDGGTANGGVNTDQTSNAMTINVDPVVVLVPPPEPDPEPDPDPEPEPPPPIIDPGPDPDPEPDPEPEPDVEEAEADDEADSEEDTGDDDEASDNGALDLSALYLADTIFSDGDNNDPTTAGAGVIRVSLQSIVGSIAMQSPAFSAGLIPTIVLDDETAVTEDSILDVNSNFNRDLDRMKENTEQGSGVNANTVGTAVVVTTGVSVGYVIWLIRSGVLLSSVLSALPAWRLIDPLPVLSFMMHKSDDEDDESLETIVESSTEENNNEEK